MKGAAKIKKKVSDFRNRRMRNRIAMRTTPRAMSPTLLDNLCALKSVGRRQVDAPLTKRNRGVVRIAHNTKASQAKCVEVLVVMMEVGLFD